MKILITGINGFVGKILSRRLIEEKHDVFGIDVEGNGKNIFAVNIQDTDSLSKYLEEISPDFIFHLAAVSRADITNPGLIFNSNVNGTLNLISAAVSMSVLPKLLFVSSSQVYGNADRDLQPLSEETPVAPVNLYGASKAASENIINSFRHEFDLPAVIVRPFNHIGAGQSLSFVVPKLVKAFKEKQPELRIGNIDVYRDFLDVRDVVSAYIKIMNSYLSGEVYNISSGRSIAIKEIISVLKKITAHKPAIAWDESLMRKNEIVYSSGDSSKIIKELGWKQEYQLGETLEWMLHSD